MLLFAELLIIKITVLLYFLMPHLPWAVFFYHIIFMILIKKIIVKQCYVPPILEYPYALYQLLPSAPALDPLRSTLNLPCY